MAASEVGPNDIIIHLVNPYKCSDCGSEFFLKSAFVEHLVEHMDKMKTQSPCHQIVCGVNLAAHQANSITVTRDILQINDHQMFELQDTSLDYAQLTPLKFLEQAGLLNLPPPQKSDCNDMSRQDIRSRLSIAPTVPQPTTCHDLAIIHNAVENTTHHDMKTTLNGQGGEISSVANLRDLPNGGVASANFEPIIPQPFIMNNGLKEETSILIEGPAPGHGQHTQEQFTISQNVTGEGLKGMRTWGDPDLESIMRGENIVLVKKVSKPEFEESGRGRATCKVCFNEYANKNVLMRHQVVHTGVKPHCCFTCFKEFYDISSLRKHMLIHKRSHRCPVCLKTFLRRRQMELHLRQHNKRCFIQFGNKYHEVHVSTSRNEREQIVHEFSLSSLLNKDSRENTDNSADGRSGSAAKDSQLSEDQNCVESTRKDMRAEHSQSNVDQGAGEIQQSSNNSQKSFKKTIYRCGHCKKFIYTRPTLSRHLMIHTNEKPFNCEKCEKQFRHKSDLVHHYKTHIKPVKCQSCGSAFSKRLYLTRHLENGCPFLAEDDKKFTLLPDLTYQCNLCSKILKSRTNVFRHMRVHAFEERKFQESDVKKISKTVKEVVTNSGSVEDFIRPLSNSVGFQCAICEEEFRFKSFISIHVRMHLNQRPFTCKECGRGFYGRYLLKKHMQNHTWPYKCPKCGKGFNRRYLMRQHFYKNHSEEFEEKMKDITYIPQEKLLRCDICGKTMKSFQRSLMQYHIRLHKDVRPHQCKVCQKTFISDVALKKHSQNHSKPYICQVCGKGFSRRYLMLDHFEKTCGAKGENLQKILKFTGVFVESSGPSTSSDSSLPKQANSTSNDALISEAPYEAETVTDIDEQTGLEAFKCIPCDKSFTIMEALQRHLKTFKKETPCKYCKTVFPNKHLSLAHQRCCLGVEIKLDSISMKKDEQVQKSGSQIKVLRVMKKMNKEIENFTAVPESKEDSCKRMESSNQNDGVSKLPVPNDDNELTVDNNLENHGVNIIKQRTILTLKKQSKYPCPECDKAFATTRGLKIHATSHVRLFKCETCGQDFTQLKTFRGHLKSHRDENEAEVESDEMNDKGEEIPSVSEVIGEASNSDDQERKCNKIKTKTSESCPQEPKEMQGSPAKKAKRLEGSSEDHKNIEMLKQQGQMDVSARLMQTGTRGRPYSCKMCRKRFTEETGLSSHVLQAHGTDKSSNG